MSRPRALSLVTMPHTAKLLRVATCLAALAGIGCGGGSQQMAPTPATFNLQAAYTQLIIIGLTTNVALSGTVTVSGTPTPFTGTGTLTMLPATAATFNTVAALAQAKTISGNVMSAGQSAPFNSSVTDYYDASTYAALGESGSSEYDVVQTPFTYPTSITGGSSGVLGTVSRYSDNTLSTPLGTAQLSYLTIAPVDPGSPASVQLTEKFYDTQSTLVETDVTTYAISANDLLTFVSATAQVGADSLTVTAN